MFDDREHTDMFEPVSLDPQGLHPYDQAHGLRRLFAAQRQRQVVLVHNPFIRGAQALLQRLTSVYAARGLHTLLVDAADTAAAPHELARIDLSACVDRLSEKVSFLAARGLPMRHVDARGHTSAFLDAVASACPQADVVLLHAGASDLTRLYAGRELRPVLLAGSRTESLTEAYAGMKLLAQRLGVSGCDLLISAEAGWPHARLLAERLDSCARRFLGTPLHDWAVIDPAGLQPGIDFERLALGLLSDDDPLAAPPTSARRSAGTATRTSGYAQ